MRVRLNISRASEILLESPDGNRNYCTDTSVPCRVMFVVLDGSRRIVTLGKARDARGFVWPPWRSRMFVDRRDLAIGARWRPLFLLDVYRLQCSLARSGVYHHRIITSRADEPRAHTTTPSTCIGALDFYSFRLRYHLLDYWEIFNRALARARVSAN